MHFGAIDHPVVLHEITVQLHVLWPCAVDRLKAREGDNAGVDYIEEVNLVID